MTDPAPPTSTPMPPLPPLTLIVATTPSLGIGLRGTLPWPPLKADLAFFARVTKRPPPRPSSDTSPSNQQPAQNDASTSQISAPGATNAVLMGRRTWESIPEKYRPLKGRVNIVISRNQAFRSIAQSSTEVQGSNTAVMTAGSIEDGIRQYQARGYGGRVFVIGGASVYEEALGMGACERVLWTRIRGEWECDTWFPRRGLAVEGDGEKGGWRKRGRETLEGWCGEEGVGGVKREGEVEFEVEMWEREGLEA